MTASCCGSTVRPQPVPVQNLVSRTCRYFPADLHTECHEPADEIDAIAAKRENAQREMERRIVAQMLTCMDDLSEQPLPGIPAEEQPGAEAGPPHRMMTPLRPHKHVLVIGERLGI